MRMLAYNPHRRIRKMFIAALNLPIALLPQIKTEFWLYHQKFSDRFCSGL